MRHLDDGSLHAWLDQARSGLDDARRHEIGRHLEACAECSRRLAELEEETLRVQSLFPAVEPSAGNVPEWSAVVARAEARQTTAGRRPVWKAAAWAASVAAIMGLGWLSNDLYRGARTAGTVTPPVSVEERAALPSVEAPETAPVPTTFEEAPTVPAPQPRVTQVAAAPGPSVLRGRVTDESGRPLAAAQVVVRGTNLGTLTNREGDFALVLPDTAVSPTGRDVTLTAQLIGYGEASRDLTARPGDTVSADLRMAPQTLALDAIVVTGTPAPVAGEPDSMRRELIVPLTDSTWGGPWTTASRSDAERLVGFPIVVVENLRVVDIAIGASEGTPVVRVIQELDGGALLTLLEAKGNVTFLAATRAGRSVAATRRGDVGIAAAAPIPVDSLDALLRRLR